MHKCIPEHWTVTGYKPRAKRPMASPRIIQARALWTYMQPTPTWRIWDRHYGMGSLHERGWTFVSTPFVGRIRTAFPKVGQTVQILVGHRYPFCEVSLCGCPVGSFRIILPPITPPVPKGQFGFI